MPATMNKQLCLFEKGKKKVACERAGVFFFFNTGQIKKKLL